MKGEHTRSRLINRETAFQERPIQRRWSAYEGGISNSTNISSDLSLPFNVSQDRYLSACCAQLFFMGVILHSLPAHY